jgi:hypothetical protein
VSSRSTEGAENTELFLLTFIFHFPFLLLHLNLHLLFLHFIHPLRPERFPSSGQCLGGSLCPPPLQSIESPFAVGIDESFDAQHRRPEVQQQRAFEICGLQIVDDLGPLAAGDGLHRFELNDHLAVAH